MAVRVSRIAQFSSGSRGFRFESHRDEAEDCKVYGIGETFEREISREGSLGQRIFERLSSTETKTPTDHRE
jgi:hypothetical protein